MKQYLISEEELSIFLRLSAVRQKETDLTFKEIADDFLKSKQPVELLAEDYELQQKAINTLNNSGLKLMEENKKLKKTIGGFRKGYADLNNYSDNLKSQLSNMKKLNKQEVYKLFNTMMADCADCLKPVRVLSTITAICNLTLPEIMRDLTQEEKKMIDIVDTHLVKSHKLKGYHDVNEFYEPKSKEEINRNKIIAILVGKILETDKDAVTIADEIIKSLKESQ